MFRKSVLFVAVAVSMAVFVKSANAGDNYLEVTETMMESQSSIAQIIGQAFGVGNTPINFTTNTDPQSRSFSFSSVPAQNYLNQPFSLTTNGVYDSILGKYNWTIAGQLGPSTISGTGSAIWVGDPTGTIETDITISGNTYHVTGTIDLVIDTISSVTSTGKYTFTGPPTGPGGPGPFGPYNGTDKLNTDGSLKHTVTVPVTPLTPTGQVIFLTGQTSPPGAPGGPPLGGGPGIFQTIIQAAPEPSSLFLVGLGAFWFVPKIRHRRNPH